MISDSRQASLVLSSGKLLLFRTDSTWAFVCSSSHPKNIARLQAFDQNYIGEEKVILVANDAMLNQVVDEVPEIAWDLIDEANESINLILPDLSHNVKLWNELYNGLEIRYVKDKKLADLIRFSKAPLISVQAKFETKQSPANFAGLPESMIDLVDEVFEVSEWKSLGRPAPAIKLGHGAEVEIVRK